MTAGIIFPQFGSVFQPYPKYFVMALFFLSFLPIQLNSIGVLFRRSLGVIAWFTIFKILALPVVVFYIFKIIAPSYAPSALLLSGISTGVTAPFISNLVGGNSALVMVMVVVTSLLVPLSLPSLCELLLSRSVEMPFAEMFQMLAFVILLPIIAAEALRRLAPRALERIMRINYPLSLLFFALINLGVFSQYSDFLYGQPARIAGAIIVGIGLCAIYGLSGVALFLKRPLEDRIAGAVSICNMNNVIVIVFASHFFSPLEPVVAAMYIIPFFGVIFPLRIYANKKP